MKEVDPGELSGFIDDELSPQRRGVVRRAIEDDPVLRAEYERLASAHAVWKANADSAVEGGRWQPKAVVPSTPTGTRRSVLAVGLGVATIAALVIAVLWIWKLGSPRNNRHVAHQPKTDGGSSASSFAILEQIHESEGLSQLSKFESLSIASRQPLKQNVVEAGVIVVATAFKSALARPDRPGDLPEHLITFRVARVLKGELTDRVITTRTPTDSKEFIGESWVLVLSPEYVAGKSRYAGLYNIKLESTVRAILAGKR